MNNETFVVTDDFPESPYEGQVHMHLGDISKQDIIKQLITSLPFPEASSYQFTNGSWFDTAPTTQENLVSFGTYSSDLKRPNK